ncbi:MAG TPA: DUF1353 domain-containing protein [Gemmatimonadales bacterium]|nr:DUF1353 domain-containing protein [Gemmatimonadales bacterium]
MCRDAERWVFTLPADFIWDSGLPTGRSLSFRDRTGTVRLVVHRSGVLTVPARYAWDGCSPKVCLWDVLIGTPDGVIDSRTKRPKTYYASLVHDALYQFLLDGLPFTRAQADRCFLRLMEETGFGPRYVYWIVVRVLGWLFVAQHRYKRKNRGRCTPWLEPE